MLLGRENELAITFNEVEGNLNSGFVYGGFSLIVNGKSYFAKQELLTINVILNHLKREIIPFQVSFLNAQNARDMFFLSCLMHGYSFDGGVPLIPNEMWASADCELSKFNAEYEDFVERICCLFNANNELPLAVELTDQGGRVFIYRAKCSEFVICTENNGIKVDLHELPLGSYKRFHQALLNFSM